MFSSLIHRRMTPMIRTAARSLHVATPVQVDASRVLSSSSLSSPSFIASSTRIEPVFAASSSSSSTTSHPAGCACCSIKSSRAMARVSTTMMTPSTYRRSSSSTSSIPNMRAQVLTRASATNYVMGIEELRRPVPHRGEVLIKVRACGLMKAEVGFPLPAVLGHEVSGTIVALGDGVPDRLKVGHHVAGTFIMPCSDCRMCNTGNEDLCETFFSYNRGKGQLYDGSTRLHRPDGTPIAMYSMSGLAEYAVIPATAVYELPSNVSFVDAAIVGCAIFTAYGAVRNVARLQLGETLAVLGVGGVGSNILQISRAVGAKQIIAIDVSDDKLALAKQLGATHTINAMTTPNVPDRVRELTNGRGVDLAFEALGRPDTFVQAVSCVRDGGRTVMVGIAPVGVTAPVDITRVVRRKIQILGSFGARARSDMPDILGMIERGQIDVSGAISRRFALKDAGEAYKLLDQGKILGRAVIDMELK